MSSYKYPKTPHLPWSLCVTFDDKRLQSTEHYNGKRVIVSEKMDGECSTIAYKHIYARSLDSADHVSRHLLKAQYSHLSMNLDPAYRICGENVYATHSIPYENLVSYFYGFSAWVEDVCLSWDQTLEDFDKYNITPVPVIYDGPWDEKLIKSFEIKETGKGQMEGYVVRLADAFRLSDFKLSVAKFVRANHVTTNAHWMHQVCVRNKLKS